MVEAVDHDIDLAEHVLDADVSAAVLPQATQVVRNVNDQCRVELVAKRLESSQIRSIRVHGEQAFSNDENAVLLILCPDLRKDVPAILVIEVTEQLNVVGGGVCPFLQAGIRQLVDDHMFARSDQTLHNAETLGPTHRI